MSPAMTCPDCGAGITDEDDLVTGRRVHRLTVRTDGSIDIDRSETVTLRHCGDCDLVIGVSYSSH